MNLKNVAVVGASGAVGNEILKVLEKRSFPVRSIKLLASRRSKGQKLNFNGEKILIEELKPSSFKGMDIALFSAGGSRSVEFAPHAVKEGCIVVDNSSAFRMDNNTPLVIPEINSDVIKHHKGIIANPNCSTIILLMAVFPIYRLSKIKRIIVSTYQSASGAGHEAMEELIKQSRAYINNESIIKKVFPHQIAFNLFSHDSMIGDDGYNTEEKKMINEVQKILNNSKIKISATCIRVPVLRAHSESINLELENDLSLSAVKKAIDEFDGTKLVDDIEKNYFPMPLLASNIDDVLVGRIRYDYSTENGIALFTAGDQLLKGAALNAVQIAEKL